MKWQAEKAIEIVSKLQTLIQEMRDEELKEFVGTDYDWAGKDLHDAQERIIRRLIEHLGNEGIKSLGYEWVHGVGLLEKSLTSD